MKLLKVFLVLVIISIIYSVKIKKSTFHKHKIEPWYVGRHIHKSSNLELYSSNPITIKILDEVVGTKKWDETHPSVAGQKLRGALISHGFGTYFGGDGYGRSY